MTASQGQEEVCAGVLGVEEGIGWACTNCDGWKRICVWESRNQTVPDVCCRGHCVVCEALSVPIRLLGPGGGKRRQLIFRLSG